MSDDRMELQYRNDAADVEAWWRHYMTRNAAHRVSYWVTVALVAGGTAWVASRFTVEPTARVVLSIIGMLAGWGLAEAGVRVSLHATVASTTRSVAGKQQFGPHRLTVGPDGVAEETPSGSHTHGWGAIEELCETKDHLFLAVAGGFAYVLPKRDIAEALQAELRTIVESGIEQKRRRRTTGCS